MATPSARPICRDMFRTPEAGREPVAGQTTRAVRPKSDAWVSADADRADDHPRQEGRHVRGRGVDPHRPPRAAGGEQQAAAVATRRAPKRGTSLRTWTDTTATVNGPDRDHEPGHHDALAPRPGEQQHAVEQHRAEARVEQQHRSVGQRERPHPQQRQLDDRIGMRARTARGTRRAARRRPATPPMNAALDQPQDAPSTMHRTRPPMPATSRTIPSRSGRPPSSGWRTSSSTRRDATTAPAASGRLTRKMRRQSTSTSTPPSGGPLAAAIAPTDAQAPTVPARASTGSPCSRRPSDVGMTSAAPTAWTARAATSTPTEGAAAQPAEPMREHHEAELERPPPAQEVAEPPGGDETRGEHDRVRVQHPRQRAVGAAREVERDRRERDVHDEEVQLGHEHADGDDGEGPAAAGQGTAIGGE